MLSFIIIVLILSSLFRRPRYWGFFPFMGGWGYRRPSMEWYHCPCHGWPTWHGRRVQGRPPRALLTFPLISGAEETPPRFHS